MEHPRGVFRILLNKCDVALFSQKTSSQVFDKLLNTLLHPRYHHNCSYVSDQRIIGNSGFSLCTISKSLCEVIVQSIGQKYLLWIFPNTQRNPWYLKYLVHFPATFSTSLKKNFLTYIFLKIFANFENDLFLKHSC